MHDKGTLNTIPKAETYIYGLFRGAQSAANIWGFGMFIQMLSYAALAREAGWQIEAILISTITIWGLLGQIAMVDIMATGGSVLTMAIAVMMANARMSAMTVSCIPVLPKRNFFFRVMMAQTIGVTAWLHTMEKLTLLPIAHREARFIGFYLFQATGATLGSIIGFYALDWIDDTFVRILVFVTPVFLLLMISVARNRKYVLTAVFGAVIGLSLYPFLGHTAIIFAGIVGGSLGNFVAVKFAKDSRS